MTEPIWLDERVLLTIHHMLIAEHGGPEGTRDPDLLESALARPRQLTSYGATPSLFDLAAATGTGIARNHPFVDGNKRTAFLAAYIFLARNGQRPTMSEADTVHVMTSVAAGEMEEVALARWLRENCTAVE